MDSIAMTESVRATSFQALVESTAAFLPDFHGIFSAGTQAGIPPGQGNPQTSLSGSLRLVFWVNSNPFPGTSYRVATYDLGQLWGGFQY